MLFFALLLQSVPAKAEDIPALPRLLDRDAASETANRRYRLDVAAAPRGDQKEDALHAVWKSCGLTGAPVCPTQPRTVLRASLSNPG